MPDLVDVARRAQSAHDRGDHAVARALLDEALSHAEVRRDEQWPKVFSALVDGYGLGTMHVLYDEEGSFMALRAFLADVVRVVRPELSGDWVKVKSTPRPHPHLGGDAALQQTEYALGAATLVETVDGEEGPRDPRDGYGYVLAVALRVPGADGLTRVAKLGCNSWGLMPRPVHFKLARFTAVELAGVRAAGARHFKRDQSAHETWALRNATEALREGARDEARRLVVEALSQSTEGRKVYRGAWRALLWLRVELEEDVAVRAQAEAAALCAEPRVEVLAALASGARVLPGWSPALARRVLAQLTPWKPESLVELGDVAHVWTGHPLWGGDDARGWAPVVSRRQTPERFGDAVAALRKTLMLADLDTLDLGVRAPHDAQVTLREDGSMVVRAVVQRRVERDGTAVWWTWLWSGGLEGAVLVTQLPLQDELRIDTTPLRCESKLVG